MQGHDLVTTHTQTYGLTPVSTRADERMRCVITDIGGLIYSPVQCPEPTEHPVCKMFQ